MKKILTLIFIFFSFCSSAQIQLSENAQISILTIGPGDALNDVFGHNAFRIKDSTFDYCFDYGRFDFNEPGFYLKFAQGKLNYWLGVSPTDLFIATYKRQNRTVREQILSLSQEEKQDLVDFLTWNAKEENKFYLYDFFFDNCASKPRDVVNRTLNNTIQFKTANDFEQETFRALIHRHVNRNSWGSLGIDLALGSVIDRKATVEDHMFLPNYIHELFAVAIKEDGTPLVQSGTTLVHAINRETKNNFWLSPLFILGIIGLLMIYITFRDYKANKRTKWLDTSLFILTGLSGIVMLLLWFATNHTATAFNYNLLWAFVLNLFVIGQVLKTQPKPWFRKYVKLLLILLCLLTLHWIIGVQVFAIGLIPLLIALGIRYVYLVYYLKD